MIIIVMGVSGSGKTTIGSLLAEDLRWRFYDADDMHSEPNKEKMSAGNPLTDGDRAEWLKTLRNLLLQSVFSNQSVVMACSALKETYRQVLRVNAAVYFVYLKGTFPEIEARMQLRQDHYMSANVLESQFETLEEPAGALTMDINQPPAEMVAAIRAGLKI